MPRKICEEVKEIVRLFQKKQDYVKVNLLNLGVLNKEKNKVNKIKYFSLRLWRWLRLRFVVITLPMTKRTARKLSQLATGIAAIGDILVMSEHSGEIQEGRDTRLVSREQRRPR